MTLTHVAHSIDCVVPLAVVQFIPEFYWEWSYPVFWAVNLFIIACIAILFKKKRWL